MMLIPNYDNPPLVVDNLIQRIYLPRFSVWYNNAALSFTENTTQPINNKFEISDLISNQYNEYVMWDEEEVRIEAAFPVRKVDTLILGGADADRIRGVIKLGSETRVNLGRYYWRVQGPGHITANSGARVYFTSRQNEERDLERRLPPGLEELPVNDQLVIVIKFDPVEADSLDLYLMGKKGQALRKLYLGSEKSFALCSSLSAGFRTDGVQNISDMGVVYGHKMNSYRTINAAWKLIDDIDRHEMENYIAAVQTVEPHYIMPVSEDYYISPMFCVLMKQALSNNKKRDNWMWEGNSLEWQEAK